MGPGTASIPIVLCTGAVREVEALQLHLEEMNIRVVYKPFNIDHLNATVSQSFALPAAGDRGDR